MSWGGQRCQFKDSRGGEFFSSILTVEINDFVAPAIRSMRYGFGVAGDGAAGFGGSGFGIRNVQEPPNTMVRP
jgi:hypothetical protein